MSSSTRAGLAAAFHDATSGHPTGTRRWQQNIKLGGDQEMIARLRTDAGENWGAIGLYREPDRPLFDAADQRFLTSASPALASGVRRALLLGEATDPEWPDAPGLVILDESLAVESSSPGAEQWLDELSEGDSSTLPAAVRAVASATLHNQSRPDQEVAMARVLTRTGAWVVPHGAPLINDGARRVAVIIEPANPDRILPLLMSAYGLTEREKEVVGLVLKGLPTRHPAHQRPASYRGAVRGDGVSGRRDGRCLGPSCRFSSDSPGSSGSQPG